MTGYLWVTLFLLLNMAIGLVRVARGPSDADRILAVQLFGTLGIAIVLMLGAGLGVTALFDVALVLALLAATTAIVFAAMRRRS